MILHFSDSFNGTDSRLKGFLGASHVRAIEEPPRWVHVLPESSGNPVRNFRFIFNIWIVDS